MYHAKMRDALRDYRGKTLSTREIRRIIQDRYPECTSILPNDHADGNKGACNCAKSNRGPETARLFDRVSRARYYVRDADDRWSAREGETNLMTVVEWHHSLSHASGKPRKQFTLVNIPKQLRDQHSINDGQVWNLVAAIRSDSFEVEIRVVSGGELRFPALVADRLATIAGIYPTETIKFSLRKKEHLNDSFNNAVSRSRKNNSTERKRRLAAASLTPKVRAVTILVFARNPDVVAETLEQAKGQCGICKKQGPFLRAPHFIELYLEVHHIIPLSEGGKDCVSNTIALCPNCHRKAHYGDLKIDLPPGGRRPTLRSPRTVPMR